MVFCLLIRQCKKNSSLCSLTKHFHTSTKLRSSLEQKCFCQLLVHFLSHGVSIAWAQILKEKKNQPGVDLWPEPSALVHLTNISLTAVRRSNDGAFCLNRSSCSVRCSYIETAASFATQMWFIAYNVTCSVVCWKYSQKSKKFCFEWTGDIS